MPKNELHIEVLGTSISISADEEEEYLNRLLETYKKAVEDTQASTGITDPLKTAVLTGFLLCDEVQKARQEKPGKKGYEEQEAEALALDLISRLEGVLDDKTPLPEGTAKETDRGSPGGPMILKLKNPVKNYDWGDPQWIPELLGQRNISRIPWAELWMGVHPGGPSCVPEAGNENRPDREPLLSRLIEEDPGYYLGEETEKTFGALPFLFKVLAAGRPLSIQAHPNLEQAREGWERENREGISLDAPNRNYKDPNHKPEILCALSPFTAMCGFREEKEIMSLLDAFSRKAPHPLRFGLEPLHTALAGPDPLRMFFTALFNLDPETRKALSVYGREQRLEKDYPEYRDEWKLVSWFAELYPGDPGIIAPLYLNLIDLEPQEAVFLPAGVLHAYVYGLGVELMADSDNVLRGGLTSKHIDKDELFRVLKFSPFMPRILKPEAESLVFKYPVPCREFSLSVFKDCKNRYDEPGPSIVIVTEGEVRISDGREEKCLKKGESAFIPAGAASGGLSFSGNYTLYAAGTGSAEKSW
ncbi:MAG: mannose-6-phosphate isomerase, class I [Treponema sp.]|jgi:mannose-6-phosphate isomerase|nr:mannose-6-phosphate isomerase, class I [Treponema sp.]